MIELYSPPGRPQPREVSLVEITSTSLRQSQPSVPDFFWCRDKVEGGASIKIENQAGEVSRVPRFQRSRVPAFSESPPPQPRRRPNHLGPRRQIQTHRDELRQNRNLHSRDLPLPLQRRRPDSAGEQSRPGWEGRLGCFGFGWLTRNSHGANRSVGGKKSSIPCTFRVTTGVESHNINSKKADTDDNSQRT